MGAAWQYVHCWPIPSSGHDKGRRAVSKRTDTTGRDISKFRSVDFVRVSQQVKAAIRSREAQSFCSYPAGEYSGEGRREAMKHKFGQVWLPTQVMGFGPLITSHKSPWPNGQGVGLLIRRLWVRVPQGMQFYVALYSDQEAMKQRCADSVLAAPLPQVGSLDRVSAHG